MDTNFFVQHLQLIFPHVDQTFLMRLLGVLLPILDFLPKLSVVGREGLLKMQLLELISCFGSVFVSKLGSTG